AALRQASCGAPQEIMIELLRARRLERVHLAALRIDARHRVLDDAVLAGGIHPLQHDQQRPAVVGIEALLQAAEALDVVRQHRLGLVLAEVDSAGVRTIDRGEAETAGMIDAITLGQLPCFHGACPVSQIWRRNADTNGGIIGSRSATPRTIRMSLS